MRRAGILGDPVAQSRSPLIHGHWLDLHRVDGSYEKLPVTADAFQDYVRTLVDAGYAGANVTAPHKRAAFELADRLDPLAERLGAVNTLVFRDNEILGSNTDGFGFVENLRQQAGGWRHDMPVLVLGAGGAARAIIGALAECGVSEIRLANRTPGKADALAPVLEGTGTVLKEVAWVAREAACAEVGLLVNTTSLGMTGKPSLEMSLAHMGEGGVVADIVYAPLQTPLLVTASDRGLESVDGLGMLLHQAVPGFEAWFGCRPKVTQALRDLVVADLTGGIG